VPPPDPTPTRNEMRQLLLALPLLIGGCAKTITDPAAVVYEGFYTWGFEVNAFQPCGSEESWWVTEGDLSARHREIAQDYQPVFVVLAGEAGPPGKYGHMGAYSREIAVKEVLEMRAAREADCK
jgi:hypothetical protein